MDRTVVYLIRHGHADWQPDENRPLSSRGRLSALRLAQQLGPLPIDAIYSSPSARAIETVAALAERRQLVPVLIGGLRERELSAATAAEFDAAVAASWQQPEHASTLGGESNAAAQGRGIAAVRSVVEASAGRHVVFSTHGSLLALILNGFDPSFGYKFWHSLTFPDVYELTFNGRALESVRRLWEAE